MKSIYVIIKGVINFMIFLKIIFTLMGIYSLAIVLGVTIGTLIDKYL